MAEKKSKWPILLWLGVLVLAFLTYLKSCTGPETQNAVKGFFSGSASEVNTSAAGGNSSSNTNSDTADAADLAGDNKNLRAENWTLLEKIAALEASAQGSQSQADGASTEELEKLSTQLASAQTRISELESAAGEIDGLKEELSGAQTQIGELQSSAGELINSRDDLSRQLETLNAQAGDYKTEMRSANSAVDALSSGVLGAFKQQLPDNNISLDTGSADQGLTARIMGLSASLPNAVSSFAQGVGERAGAESRGGAASQIQTLAGSLQGMKDELGELKTANVSLEQQLADAQGARETMQTSLVALEEEKGNLEFAYQQLKSAGEQKQPANSNQDTVIDTEISQLRVQIVNLVGQNKVLGEQLAEARSGPENANAEPVDGSRLDELAGQLDDTKTRLRDAERTANTSSSELTVATQKITGLTEQLSTLGGEKEMLVSELQTVRQSAGDAQKLSQDLTAAQEKIVDLNNEINLLSQTEQKLAADLEGARKSIQETSGVSSELASTQQKVTELTGQVESLTGEKQTLMSNLGEAQESLQQASVVSSELTGAQAKISDLTTEISSLTQEKQKLTQDVATARGQADSLNQELTKVVSMRDALGGELENVKSRVSELSLGKEQTGAILESTNEALTNLAIQKVESDQQISSLRKRIEEQQLDFNIKFQELEDNTSLIRIDSDIAYQSGSATLEPQGREVLALIAQSLNRYENRDVSLEGHTDNLPIRRGATKFDSNWELSAARASGAARYLISQGVDPSRLRAVGFGSSRPISDNETRENRSKNRRLEIRFVPAKLKEKVESVN